MLQKCNTRPNDPTGTLAETTNCLSLNCLFPLAALQSYASCFDCMLDNIASQEEYGNTLNACTTQVKAPYGYEGQLSTMILSRYPLAATDSYILPSTNYRRGALYAKVQLEDQYVDFYCGFFISTLIATDLPYDGNFGMGGGAKDPGQTGAYAQEQLLEAKELVAWIKQKSGSNPAIIVGDWRSSVGAGVDGGAPLDGGAFSPPTDLVPQTMAEMSSNLVAWNAPGWVPQCDYCPGSQNVLNAPGTDSYFVQQPFLYNWPSMGGTPVVDETLTFTKATVPTANGGMVPPSPYYGLEFHVLRPTM
jgi:hypothetical protein